MVTKIGTAGDDTPRIDVNEQIHGDQSLAFIGQAQVTGAGQLHFFQAGDHTHLQANMNDLRPRAELAIILDPPLSMQGGDLLL